MKKYLAIYAALITFLVSCKKECEFYYEGKKCETEVREKYYGTYIGTATIGGVTNNATAKITASNTGAKYFIMDGQLDCYLTSENKFYIPGQLYFTNSGTFNIEGSGSFNGSQIIYNAAMSQGGGAPYLVNFTGTK